MDELVRGGSPVGKARILLADDNILIQMMTIKMLEKLGYQADAVDNGLDVLKALAQIPYDIILMDCQMPLMDGLEATRKIRITEGQTRHTIIIGVTAHAFQTEIDMCFTAGMDDYMSKPVDTKTMGAMLDRWLLKIQCAGSPIGTLAGTNGGMVESGKTPDADKTGSADFDRETFMDRLLGDQALAQELIEAFVLEMPRLIDALGEAIRLEDTALIKRHAHKIRGAAVNICGGNFGKIAAEIEQAGDSSDPVDLNRRLSLLRHYFETMKELMKAGL